MLPYIAFGIVAAFFGLLIAVDRWNARRVRRLLLVHRTRESFAEIRRRSLRFLESEDLRADSATFSMLYEMSSLMVRRSQSYEHIASAMLRSLMESDYRRGSKRLLALQSEACSWSSGVQRTWGDLNRAIMEMVFDFYWPMRLARRVYLAPGMRPLIAPMAEAFARNHPKSQLGRGMETVETGRQQLRGVAA